MSVMADEKPIEELLTVYDGKHWFSKGVVQRLIERIMLLRAMHRDTQARLTEVQRQRDLLMVANEQWARTFNQMESQLNELRHQLEREGE